MQELEAENKYSPWASPTYFSPLLSPSLGWEAVMDHGHVYSEFLSPSSRSWKQHCNTESWNSGTLYRAVARTCQD